MSGPVSNLDFYEISGPIRGRQVARLLRIYKASCGKAIRIDDIFVNEDVRKISIDKFHHSAVQHMRTKLLHHTGVSRTVSTITVIGDYNTLNEDMTIATWDKPSDENDIIIDMTALPDVGETV